MKAGTIRTFNAGSGMARLASNSSSSILATPTPAGTVFRKSPPPSLLGSLSPAAAAEAHLPDIPPEEQQDGPGGAAGGGGSGGGRRRKQCLSSRERNVRRIESNERERLRMHGLNEAFQVSNDSANVRTEYRLAIHAKSTPLQA